VHPISPASFPTWHEDPMFLPLLPQNLLVLSFENFKELKEKKNKTEIATYITVKLCFRIHM
jgi:hypothetical protein